MQTPSDYQLTLDPMRVHIDIRGPADAAAALVETGTVVLGSCAAALDGCRLTAACSHAESLDTRCNACPLSVNEGIYLADHLCTQMDALARRGWSIVSLNMHDMVVIDGQFVLCNTEVMARTVGGRVAVSNNTRTREFAAPEVQSATDGQMVDSRCACFAAGKLVAHALFPHGDETTTVPASVPIGSKLYWFLDRCMKLDARDRMMLLV